jgi:DNA polymerase V
MSERLVSRGILTIGDVYRHGPQVMREEIGVVGERLFYELKGIPAASSDTQKNASIMSTRSFGKPVTEQATLLQAASHHLSHVAEKLRQKELKATSVVVYTRYRDHDGAVRAVSHVVVFEKPLSDTRTMAVPVMAALRTLFNMRSHYTKVGIIAQGLVAKEGIQRDLFGEAANSSADALMDVVDALNVRFGHDAVMIGTAARTHVWKSRTDFLSPSYTTSWTELPVAFMRT